MISDGIFYSKGPVIADREFDICRVVLLNEISRETLLLHFKQHLNIVVETRSVMRRYVDGVYDSDGPHYTDYYGFLTSPHDYLVENQKKRLPESDVYEEIETSIEYHYGAPRIQGPYDHSTAYYCVPRDWIVLDRQNTIESVEKWHNMEWPEKVEFSPQFFGQKVVDEKHIIWSSRNSPEDNRMLYEKLLLRCVEINVFDTQKVEDYLVAYDNNIGEMV